MLADQQQLKNGHREAVVLAEMKRLLGFPSAVAAPSSSSTSPAAATPMSPEEEAAARDIYDTYGLSMEAVDAYLLRYLRSKYLNIKDAVVKLRRRRLFESTLPMITVTPATVAALRKGIFRILDHDLEGRPVLYINAAAPTLSILEMDDVQRLHIFLLEFMQAQCLLRSNERAAELQWRHHQEVAVSAPSRNSVDGSRRHDRGASNLGPTTHDMSKDERRYLQQFTLLVNEEGAQWVMQASLLKNCSNFINTLTKYYPHMLGNVLILGASADTRAAIQACLINSPEDVRQSVHMIERVDLPRYMDACAIPIELGGHKQANGSAISFSETVLRHWFTLTSLIEDERISGNGVSDPAPVPTMPAPVAVPVDKGNAAKAHMEQSEGLPSLVPLLRPLYIPPPPLSTTQRRISRQRYTMELQHLSNSGDVVCEGISRSALPESKQLHETVDEATSRDYTHSLGAPMRATSGNDKSIMSHHTSLKHHDATDVEVKASVSCIKDVIDDGVCSTLSSDDSYSDEMMEKEGVDNMPSPVTTAVHTRQLYTAASSLGASMTLEGEVNPSAPAAGHHANHSAVSITAASYTPMSREEMTRLTANPEDAIAELRQERHRRQRAEQALHFRNLGIELDIQNASTIERELAAMHQDLNVLVAEILVKAGAAARRHNVPPTLNQLLDLTLTAFDNATRTPSTVPAMALAEPMQRDAVSTSCCNFM